MMTPRLLGFVLALAGARAIPLAAQQPRDTTRPDSIPPRLVEVVVEGRKPLATVGGAAGVRLQLERLSLPPAPSLDEVLRTLPALHVRRNSRGESEILVRGSDSRQVAVLLDGIPLTLAWDGRADFSVMPATAVHEIEFIRGLSSILYGPNVLGGIVELSVGHSSQRQTETSAQVTAGFDQVGGFGGTASIAAPFGGRRGNWLVRAGAEYRDSPGVPLARGVSEPVPTSDDLRLNTDSRTVGGFGSARYQTTSGAWFSFSGSVSSTERGIAAELGVENPRFWRYPHVSRAVAVFSGGTGHHRTPFGGIGDLEASLGLDLGRTEIDAYTSRGYTEISGFEDGTDRTLTLRLVGDHTLTGRADLRGAFTLAEIRHHEFLPEGDARYRQRLMSLAGETVWRLIEDGRTVNALRVSVGGAYDAGMTPESGGREPLGTISEWGGRLGVSMVLGGGQTLLHGAISRRGRFPSLRELYSGALNRFAPNPGLQPEKLLAVEAGVTTRIGDAEIQAVAFRQRMNDAIVRVTLPDRRFLRVNRNRLDSYGIELLATALLGPVSVGSDLTLQSAYITDLDAGAVSRPENLPNVLGSVYARVPVGLGVTAAAEARITGGQFCIDPGTGLDTKLQGRTVFNGELARPWRIRSSGGVFTTLETRLVALNAGDVALYDQCGLPQPGRVLSLQVRFF